MKQEGKINTNGDERLDWMKSSQKKNHIFLNEISDISDGKNTRHKLHMSMLACEGLQDRAAQNMPS